MLSNKRPKGRFTLQFAAEGIQSGHTEAVSLYNVGTGGHSTGRRDRYRRPFARPGRQPLYRNSPTATLRRYVGYITLFAIIPLLMRKLMIAQLCPAIFPKQS